MSLVRNSDMSEWLDKRIDNREKATRFIDSLKRDGKCQRCGFKKAAALDFHHVWDEKDYSISEMRRNGMDLDKIRAEIDKCILLCANCHRLEHS